MKGATLAAILVTVAMATLLFHAIVHQVSSVFLDTILRPDIREAIESSLGDQKALRKFDSANEPRYRRRFDDTQRLLNRIDVLAMNRERVLRRVDLVLAGTFALSLFAATFSWTLRQHRSEERRRNEYLARLTAWQEASRRHAHEIKTPLTAARMEIDRLDSLLAGGSAAEEIHDAVESVCEELDRIARFTKEFSSFATVGQPLLRPERLDRLLAEFCEMFANAWPNLALRTAASSGPVFVNAGPRSAAAGARQSVHEQRVCHGRQRHRHLFDRSRRRSRFRRRHRRWRRHRRFAAAADLRALRHDAQDRRWNGLRSLDLPQDSSRSRRRSHTPYERSERKHVSSCARSRELTVVCVKSDSMPAGCRATH
jgi:hypothetical protein